MQIQQLLQKIMKIMIHKLTKLLINPNTLIQYVRKQDSLISPGLGYEHFKVLLGSKITIFQMKYYQYYEIKN